MWWKTACPKCRGNVTARRDEYGVYVSCIHCGHELTPQEIQRARHETVRAGVDSPKRVPSLA